MEQTGYHHDFHAWAEALGTTEDAIQAVWADLLRRGLAAVEGGAVVLSPLAMRRATSDVQRRLASHLSGYVLTENPYIVRRAGDPPGSPQILNTRILVEYIANYFRGGSGVLEIQEDLPQLAWLEIEAAIQYYLNHRQEIEQEIRLSREIHEAHAPKQAAAAA